MPDPAGRLTPGDLEVLAFERVTQAWRPGPKQAVILERFNDTATRYYQRLNTLLDHPEALAYDPQLVNRLRAARDDRSIRRQPRRHP